MRTKIIIATLFTTLILLNSCFLIDNCDGMETPQLLDFGEHQIEINSHSDTLLIGDSIRFRITTSNFILDSINLDTFEIDEIQLGFYVTRDTEESIDTSLIDVFDEHFDIIVNVGETINPYHFNLQRTNLNFELDFYYVCKKELKYYIPIRFNRVNVNGVNTECMDGDTETWSSRLSIESEFNTFENQSEFMNYFGFVPQRDDRYNHSLSAI